MASANSNDIQRKSAILKLYIAALKGCVRTYVYFCVAYVSTMSLVVTRFMAKSCDLGKHKPELMQRLSSFRQPK